MKILCAGQARYIIEAKVDHFIEENKNTKIDNVVEKIGGPICDIASLLKFYKEDVSYIGYVGSDEYGLKIKNLLKEENIDNEYLLITDRIKTPVDFIIKNNKNNSKTVIEYSINNDQLESIDENIKPNIMIMDTKEYNISASLIEKYNNIMSILLVNSNDFTNDIYKKVDFALCDFDVINEMFDNSLDENDLQTTYLSLKQYFKTAIVFLKSGCLYEYNGEIKLLPYISTINDDRVWIGSFVYALANKYEFEDAILFAQVASSMKKDELTISNIKERYNEYK